MSGVSETFAILYSATLLAAAVSCLGFGLYILAKDPFSTLSRVTCLSMIAMAVFAGGEAIGFTSGLAVGDLERYVFWSRINISGGLFILPCLVWMAMYMTRRQRLLASRVVQAVLWVPAVVLAIAIAAIPGTLYVNAHGEFLQSMATLVVESVWLTLLGPVFFWLLIGGLRKTKSECRRRQIRTLLLGMGLPVAVTVLEMSLVPLAPWLLSVNAAALSLAVGMVFVARGVIKHGAFVDRGELLSALFGRLAEVVLVADSAGRIVLANERACAKLGRTADELIDHSLLDLLIGGDKAWQAHVEQTRERESVVRQRIALLTRSGSEIALLANITRARDRYIVVGSDIGELIAHARALEQAVAQQATALDSARVASITDVLTGCFNRRKLDEDLVDAIAKATVKGCSISFLMVDIDHFKTFNDTYGHQVGDQVLKAVSTTLRDNLRQGDCVYRLGGEEFAIILLGAPSAPALLAAERLRRAVEERFLQGKEDLRVTISVGVATCPPQGATPELLLRSSDVALYEAKAHGRNRVCSLQTDGTAT